MPQDPLNAQGATPSARQTSWADAKQLVHYTHTNNTVIKQLRSRELDSNGAEQPLKSWIFDDVAYNRLRDAAIEYCDNNQIVFGGIRLYPIEIPKDVTTGVPLHHSLVIVAQEKVTAPDGSVSFEDISALYTEEFILPCPNQCPKRPALYP